MAKVREYDFTTGIETSTVPDPGTPSADNDTISLGYLNDMSYWGEAVASYAAMRALTSTQRIDRQARHVDVSGGQIWFFDSASTSADDGSTVLKPDDILIANPGRWVKLSTGSGSGGGGGSGIETLLQKLENEKFRVITEDLDSSLGNSFVTKPYHRYFEANLLKDYASGASTIDIVWNGVAVNDSDKNYDSATGWTATGAGATVGTTSTAGQFTIGTAAIKFDKNNTATQAGVRYDRGSQNLALIANTRVWCYFYLPSVTGLTNVYLRVYKDSTSNYQEFTATTKFDSSALAVGLNLVFFDISTGGTAGGTGWTASDLSRYVEVGVTTSSAGQTYTGVAFDALYFSYRYPDRLGVIYTEYTFFNSSVKNDIIIDSTNTRHDGQLTLAASVAANISGGISGAARGRIMRTTLLAESGIAIMDNDSSYSGSITTTQDVRMSLVLRESLSQNYAVVVDAFAIQSYEVTTVGGSTIGVYDPVNQSANLLNGDTMDIFRPYYRGGIAKYVLLASRTLTANASNSSSTTTLTLTTTSIQVGDIVCKRHISGVAASVNSKTANESFSALSLVSDPNGVQLLSDSIPYPNYSAIFGHYWMGDQTQAGAIQQRVVYGSGPTALTVTGTVNSSGDFQRGRFALVGPSSTSNHFSVPSSYDMSGNANKIQASFWMFFDGTYGSLRPVLYRHNGATSGWFIYVVSGASTMQLQVNGTATTAASINTGWNHIHMVVNDSTSSYLYINGVKTTTLSVTPDSISQPIYALNGPTGGINLPGPGLRMGDLVLWKDGVTLSQSEVLSIYNAGIFKPMGYGGSQRYKYSITGGSGDRLSLRARLTRSTTALRPMIAKMGMIVS